MTLKAIEKIVFSPENDNKKKAGYAQPAFFCRKPSDFEGFFYLIDIIQFFPGE